MMNLIKKGFTLIELLIVIAIIGIMVALILPNLAGARERARDARRKADLNSVQTALRLYYNDAGAFPATLTWNSSLKSADNVTTYMALLPIDPSSSSTNILYNYSPSAGGGYIVVAVIENASDPDIAPSHARCPETYAAYSGKSATDYVVCEE